MLYKRQAMLFLVISAALPHAAHAQSIQDLITRKLDQKYAILQQQADTERMRAETERAAAERATVAPSAQSAPGGVTRYVVAGPSNDFAGMKVPKYTLPNGASIQASGGFHPYATTRCTADCFVPLGKPK
jgi:hypothetical protein